jgi:hypothetical protein
MSSDLEKDIQTHERLANEALARAQKEKSVEAKRRAFYIYRTNKRRVKQLKEVQQDSKELSEI